MRWAWPMVVALVAALVAVACSTERDRPSGYGGPIMDAGATDAFDAGYVDGAPPPDAAGFCGNEFHTPSYRPPNLYFVFDRSGSMADLTEPEGISRFRVVRSAALDLVRTLGPLINVGAALLPRGNLDDNPCSAGGEVFPVTRGDSITGDDGPTTRSFAAATLVTPYGGTPIGATLDAIYDELRFVKGNTVVLLFTDGAPNCNPHTSCTIAECIPNIEGYCPPDEDCCVPGGIGGPENCVDRDATVTAIEQLGTIGIETYVIGIPGSAIYSDVLDEMATAGGTAQGGATLYHRVDDLALLGTVLAEIAADSIRCTFALTDPPDDPGMTNVYLDAVLLPYDEIDGWTWGSGDDTRSIVLHGKACQRLKTGGATTVQVVTGCPTETPR